MEILCEGAFWNVTVTWSKPTIYENLIKNGSIHDNEAHLYMINGRYQNYMNKVFYIGKTYENIVSNRLNQKDHKKRYEILKESYPKHTLFVSHGIVEIVGGKRTAKRIDEIESILIYSMPSDHCINEKSYFSHGVTAQYLIENKGYKSGMPKKIGIGVFVK